MQAATILNAAVSTDMPEIGSKEGDTFSMARESQNGRTNCQTAWVAAPMPPALAGPIPVMKREAPDADWFLSFRSGTMRGEHLFGEVSGRKRPERWMSHVLSFTVI